MDPELPRMLADVDPKALGERIRAARFAAGLRQGDLAGSQVSGSYISRIEAGLRRPDLPVLMGIAKRLEVDASALLTDAPAQSRREIQLQLEYAEIALAMGQVTEAVQCLEALDRDSQGAHEVEDRLHLLMARAFEAQGRFEEAIDTLEELLEQSSTVSRLEIGIFLSRCHREAGDLSRAIEVGEGLLQEQATSGLAGSDESVQLTVTVAAAYFERGDGHHAVKLCRTAMAEAERLGSPRARASAYWNASMVEFERSGAAGAVLLAERALALLGEGNDARNLARLRSQLGIMQLQLDPPALEEAEENLRRAGAAMLDGGSSLVDRVRNDVAIARGRFIAGQFQTACDLARKAYETSREVAPFVAADALTVVGQSCMSTGETAAAAAAFREATLVLSAAGADRSIGQLWMDLAGLLEVVGDSDAALDAYRRAAVASGLRPPAQHNARAYTAV